jgi:hypothetical protein
MNAEEKVELAKEVVQSLIDNLKGNESVPVHILKHKVEMTTIFLKGLLEKLNVA